MDESSRSVNGDSSAVLELETTVLRRGWGRGRLALGSLIVVLLVVGGLAVIARSGGQDADATLRSAQAVVEGNASYRFEVLEVSRTVVGEPDGAGSDTTTRSLTTGSVAAPDRWHIVQDTGDMFDAGAAPFETIRVGDTMYSTDPFTFESGAEGPAWVASPADGVEMTVADIASMYEDLESSDEDMDLGGYDDRYLLDIVMMAYLYDMGGQPSSVTRLVREAVDPVVEEQLSDGGVRLRTRLAPIPELAEVAEEPIPVVDVLLDLNADDEPVQATFTAEVGQASADIKVSFSDWGLELAVDAPAEGDVERTPWLPEEALAALDPALLLAPSELPSSMALMFADVYAADEFAERGSASSSDCTIVDLVYGPDVFAMDEQAISELSEEELDTIVAETGHLMLSVTTPGCSDEYDDTPFDQELGGVAARGGEGSWEMQVGIALVRVDSSFGDDVLAPLVASIRPVSVDDLAASVPAWVATSDLFGDYAPRFGFGVGP